MEEKPKIRAKDLYRGKHQSRRWVKIVCIVLGVLCLLVFLLFYSMQKYIVYSRDTLTLALPILSDGTTEAGAAVNTPRPVKTPIPATIVEDPPDFDAVEPRAGENLKPVHALYVPSEKINAEGITNALLDMADENADALLLNMKPESGILSYVSSVDLAASYETSGTFEIRDSIATLKEAGVYLIAQISCLVDERMATRNTPMAIQDSSGNAYRDERNRYWLNPENKDVSSYIVAIIHELSAMGFDEIVLSNLRHPQMPMSQNTQSMESALSAPETSSAPESLSAPKDPFWKIAGFSMRVSKKKTTNPPLISVFCETEALRNGRNAQTGQDASLFFKVFDRVYVNTSRDMLSSDRDISESLITLGEAGARFVPVLEDGLGGKSWVIKK